MKRWASHSAHTEGMEDVNKVLVGKKLKGRDFRIKKESWVRRMLRSGLHWYSSPQEPFAGSLGHSNEYSIRIKYGEYRAALCDYQLFHSVCTKNDSQFLPPTIF
jgi:hypothetical protein